MRKSENLRTGRKRYLVLAAKFNHWITRRLLEGARRRFRQLRAKDGQVDVAWVPGSFELPAAARAAAVTGKYHGIVCLGAVIKGETSHDEHIAAACAHGIQTVAATTGVPVTFGVITAGSFDQAQARARLDGGRNLGADAAGAAVEMAALVDRLQRKR